MLGQLIIEKKTKYNAYLTPQAKINSERKRELQIQNNTMMILEKW